jgi:hypothetical protein
LGPPTGTRRPGGREGCPQGRIPGFGVRGFRDEHPDIGEALVAGGEASGGAGDPPRAPVSQTGTQRLKRLFMRAPRMRGNGLATPPGRTPSRQ